MLEVGARAVTILCETILVVTHEELLVYIEWEVWLDAGTGAGPRHTNFGWASSYTFGEAS